MKLGRRKKSRYGIKTIFKYLVSLEFVKALSIMQVCLIKMNQHKNTFILIKLPQILCFKHYLFFNKFILVYYNQHYYIYIKPILSHKSNHWALFSYSMDKYYTSINLNYKNTNAYFVKQADFDFNELDYTYSLINFKRLNATFASPQKLDDYSVINYYMFNKHQSENLYKNTLNYTQNMLDNIDEEMFDTDLYVNTFKYKTKLMITENRKMLLKFLNFKLKRQYRITKFLTKFIKFKVKNSISFFEMTVSNVLMMSKFVHNTVQCQLFFQNRYIYVNGVVNTDPLKKLKKGDCIQLGFSKKYIDFFFNWFNGLSKLNLKYFNKFFKKFKGGKGSSDTDDETKPSRANDNKKAQALTIFKKPFPEFLEIDFLTLSVIIIYNPISVYLLNHRSYYIYNHYLNRLYNWKYLT
jgi:hypothetical protein